ncbi:DUF2020 domain-containing protein [Corynebacterium liangguodongii]|uniref:DUF2020 domain-containing protein n=2 Tax=Corynebacterium liangguodongii TaxID=2079535 RepID=A0A2S0WGG0_9CORY|nr:DUF2020 domain-containing protein [Corynebacterium liangguodongii]PWB99234.1 DUF2020 domain-containing protein [Corynebacterium liangguodongii]
MRPRPTPSRLSTAIIAAAMSAAAATGCSAETDTSGAPAAVPGDAGLGLTELPAAPREENATCPYLDSQWVAEANGQKVTGVAVDDRFETPACEFWSYAEQPQLTVLVRHMASPQEAMAVVDWATPIEHTEPADDPPGWNGGRHGGGAVPGRAGAAYSVAKGPVAVTVFTNQNESVKAQVVAERVIATLGL